MFNLFNLFAMHVKNLKLDINKKAYHATPPRVKKRKKKSLKTPNKLANKQEPRKTPHLLEVLKFYGQT